MSNIEIVAEKNGYQLVKTPSGSLKVIEPEENKDHSIFNFVTVSSEFNEDCTEVIYLTKISAPSISGESPESVAALVAILQGAIEASSYFNKVLAEQ